MSIASLSAQNPVQNLAQNPTIAGAAKVDPAAQSGMPGDFLAFLMQVVGGESPAEGILPAALPANGAVKSGLLTDKSIPATDAPIDNKPVEGNDSAQLSAEQMAVIMQFLQPAPQLPLPQAVAVEGGEIAAPEVQGLQGVMQKLQIMLDDSDALEQVDTKTDTALPEAKTNEFTQLLDQLNGTGSKPVAAPELKELLTKLKADVGDAEATAAALPQAVASNNDAFKADFIQKIQTQKLDGKQNDRQELLAALDTSLQGNLQNNLGGGKAEFRVTSNESNALQTVLQKIQGKTSTLLPEAIAPGAAAAPLAPEQTAAAGLMNADGSALALNGLGLKTDVQATAFATTLNQAANPQLHPAVAQASAQLQAMAAARRNQTVTINLQPAELGAIEIKVRFEGGKMKASIVADRSDTLDLMKDQSDDLQKALQQAGIQADGAALSFDLRGNKNNQQAFNEFFGRNAKAGTELELNKSDNINPADLVAVNQFGDNGKIDVRL